MQRHRSPCSLLIRYMQSKLYSNNDRSGIDRWIRARRTHDAAKQLKLQESNNLAILQQTQLLNDQSRAIQQILRSASSHMTFISTDKKGEFQEDRAAQVKTTHDGARNAHSWPAQKKERRLSVRSRRRWRLCCSSWYASKMWELSLSMTQTGITFSLKTSRLVPSDAPLFEACRDGDLAQVRLLFQNGHASPLDYSYDEWRDRSTTALTVRVLPKSWSTQVWLIITGGGGFSKCTPFTIFIGCNGSSVGAFRKHGCSRPI